MPVKWKIFLAFNIVSSIPALICLVRVLINVVNYFDSYSDFLLIFVILFGLLMITINGLLNIYVLQRFFPDKLIPATVKRLNIVSLVTNILVAIGILIVCVYGATEVFGPGEDGRDNSSKIVLVILSFLWLIQVVVLFMQGQLPGIISRNNRQKMRSLIDSIGE